MRILPKLALAAGLPAVAIAAFGQAASAAPTTPPTVPPTTGSVPADWQVLVDDTATLTFAAPPTWSDIDPVPAVPTSGQPLPWLEASPDIASFHETFDTAGALLVAFPRVDDLAAFLDEHSVGTCGEPTVEPFTNASFTGLVEYQDCGEGVEHYLLALDSPSNPTVTLLLEVGVTSAEAPGTADTLISSVAFAGAGVPTSTPVDPTAPTVPVPTVPGDTAAATTAATAPPTVPAPPAVPDATAPAVPSTLAPATVPGATTAPGEATTLPPLPTDPGATPTVAADAPSTVAGAVPVVDDTGRITVAVPPTWTEVATAHPDRPVPYITASPNQAVFQASDTSTFTTPGVIYQAIDYTADTAGEVSGAVDATLCTPGEVLPYDDGVFTGHIAEYTACGGTEARMYFLAASPADASFTAVLLIQVVEPGNAELNTILGSFNYATPS